MQHVVSFSGGKDSTAMLLLMISKGMPIDRVISIDTTKEFPAMYRHIQQVQEYIRSTGIIIEVVPIDFDYWFGEHIKTKGKLKGHKGYGWPDMRIRWCTALKSESFQRTVYTEDGIYNARLRGRGKRTKKNIIEYHGIAFDEQNRTEQNRDGRTIAYPLVDWQITEKQALQYCYDKGFHWEGLYDHFDRVSCFCCPLARIKELKNIYTYYPQLWDIMLKMDTLSYRDFKNNCTLEQLSMYFNEYY